VIINKRGDVGCRKADCTPFATTPDFDVGNFTVPNVPHQRLGADGQFLGSLFGR
jgi:hypothetical protein